MRLLGLSLWILVTLALMPRQPAIASHGGVSARVSVSGASQGNGDSFSPATNEDGRYIAFSSFATNLVGSDTNGWNDVFVHDRLLATTTRVSRSTAGVQGDGPSDDPSLSGDGRYVAFWSFATNLAPGDANGVYDIFIHDRQTGVTVLASLSTAGAQGDADSEQPSLSADGRYVAFTSQASNLVSGSPSGYHVYVRDRDTDADMVFDEAGAVSTTLVSVSSGGAQGNHFSFAPAMSGDGRYVAFTSYASNLVTGDTNGASDVFVRDRQAGTTTRLSLDTSDTEADADSDGPAISHNGRFVAFRSFATNLVSGDNNGTYDVFVRDRDTDEDGVFDEPGAVSTTRVSVSSAGAQADNATQELSISADGLYVAFTSHATNLVSGDSNAAADIFVHHLQSGVTTRVSVSGGGTEANAESHGPAISGNGCSTAFASFATNLVTGDTNAARDIFVSGGDRDGDGLCDDWETNGIDYNGDGTVDLALNQSPFNASVNHKDLFVEIDWMDCNQGGCTLGDTHNHQPNANGLQDVVNAFAAAPVSNPDGLGGITLHLMTDEAVRHITPILFLTRGAGTADDFDDLKAGNPANPCGTGASDGHFGTAADRSSANCANRLAARRLAFRYAIFGHDQTPYLGSSGIAELPGNDFLVTLGGWSATSIQIVGGQRAAEAAVLMHEFGHSVNLRHGGSDDNNCKPNYLSVMSYSLTFVNMDPTRPLDYSRQTLLTLNESSLSEPAGIGGPSGRRTIHGKSGAAYWAYANTAIDWNRNGSTTNTGVAEDVNRLDSVGGCGAAPSQTLFGFNDWSNVRYSFRGSSDFGDGPRLTVLPQSEITEGEAAAAAASMDFDEDGLSNAADNCPAAANPGQENAVHPATPEGDACEDPDSDGWMDSVDGCPDLATYWLTPEGDEDCDGFPSLVKVGSRGAEDYMGTDPAASCPADTIKDNEEPDAWPMDNNDDRTAGLSDILAYIMVFGQSVPPGPARFDINQDGMDNLSDILAFIPFFNLTCTP